VRFSLNQCILTRGYEKSCNEIKLGGGSSPLPLTSKKNRQQAGRLLDYMLRRLEELSLRGMRAVISIVMHIESDFFSKIGGDDVCRQRLVQSLSIKV